MTTGKKVVNLLNAHYGSGGKFVWDWYGNGSGWSWCNAAVCWAFAKAGAAKLFYGGKKVSYCPTSIKWCKANLAQIPVELAQPGDIVYFDWELNGNPNHIGFIWEKGTHSVANTIEGNTGGTYKGKYYSSIVYRKARTAKYIQGVFRPGYPMSSKPSSYLLKIDGDMYQQTTYALQHALGLKEDGILGKATVKALQKLIGANADGVWGTATSKKLQKYLKVTADGDFGKESVKALQRWLNKLNTPVKERKDPEPEKEPEPIPETGSEEKKGYPGKLPDLKVAKTTQQVIDDAVEWAKWVAKDNRFHYGYTNKSKSINAHHNGCFFCGTNVDHGSRSKKGIVNYKRTYCCNPYVHAAWAHGGQVPAMLKVCKKGSSYGYKKSEGYNKSTLFKALGHPNYKDLKKGDVLCSDHHVALYVGNGKIAEAVGVDDNKRNSKDWNRSIRVKDLTSSNYKSFPRVHRFKGSVSTTKSIEHGDISDQVLLVQKFLNWYGNYGLTEDRICGGATVEAIKDFQKKEGLKGSGWFGPQSLEKAKAARK